MYVCTYIVFYTLLTSISAKVLIYTFVNVHNYVHAYEILMLRVCIYVRTYVYGTAQLQLHFDTRGHAWYHEKITGRPVTC